MKLVDANVLVYAVDASSPYHGTAKRWLDHALAGGSPVGFDWLALVAFLRITTKHSVSDTPLSPAEATSIVENWLEARSAHVLSPGLRHAERIRDLVEAAGGSGGNLVNDAHLAALALEHKATIVTFDSDFGRFPGIKWEQPR